LITPPDQASAVSRDMNETHLLHDSQEFLTEEGIPLSTPVDQFCRVLFYLLCPEPHPSA
jgi:hypothetical protein